MQTRPRPKDDLYAEKAFPPSKWKGHLDVAVLLLPSLLPIGLSPCSNLRSRGQRLTSVCLKDHILSSSRLPISCFPPRPYLYTNICLLITSVFVKSPLFRHRQFAPVLLALRDCFRIGIGLLCATKKTPRSYQLYQEMLSVLL
jgi:hypothetical protein